MSGGLIAAFTAPYAILVDASSFLVSGGFTAAIRKHERIPPSAAASRGCCVELWEGLRYVDRSPAARPQALATGTSNFATNVVFSIYFVYAYRYLDLTPALLGLVVAIGGDGLARSARRRPTGCAEGSA